MDNCACEAFIPQIPPEEIISFSEHGGWTLRGCDEMRLECHLIVSSLARFVNTLWQRHCDVLRRGEWAKNNRVKISSEPDTHQRPTILVEGRTGRQPVRFHLESLLLLTPCPCWGDLLLFERGSPLDHVALG